MSEMLINSETIASGLGTIAADFERFRAGEYSLDEEWKSELLKQIEADLQMLSTQVRRFRESHS